MVRNKLFSYFGAKTKLLSLLYQRHPPNYQEMINAEVFGGSGVWLYNKKKSYIELFNDRDKGISAIFWCLKHRKKEFFEKLRYSVADELHYEWYDHYDPATIVDFAVRSAYKIHFSFSGRVGSNMITPSKYRPKGDNKHVLYEEELWEKWAERFRKVFISHRDFQEFLEYYDRNNFYAYLDPPYFVSTVGGYYGENFSNDDHIRLFRTLENMCGFWLLSYDDDDRVRELYKDFHIEEVYIRYQVKGTQKHLSKELLISNYKTKTTLNEFF